MAPAFVTPVPLLSYPDPSVSDYRFAISPDGSRLIFERSIAGSGDLGSFGPPLLYYADLSDPSQPSLFPPAAGYPSSTRPDWSWYNEQVAFCVGEGIVVTEPDGSDAAPVPSTKGMIYPAWYPNVTALAVMNLSVSAAPYPAPNPHTSVISASGELDIPVVANATLFAGMPSVNPQNPNQFVFAGQPVAGQSTYNQDENYIWFVDRGQDPIAIRPLDQKANPTGPFQHQFQGRAPWWSPDGKWVAFESYRNDSPNYELYAIYIQDSQGANSAMQVIAGKYNGNHAKWLPNGSKLVATLRQSPPAPARGLYSLDASAFIG